MKNSVMLFIISSTLVFIAPLLQADMIPQIKVLKRGEALCQDARNMREMYFKIWKEQFLKKNNMDQVYFDKHISIINYDVSCVWVDGLSFNVRYKIIYDWLDIENYDSLVIFLYKEGLYGHSPIKIDQFFDKTDLSYAVDAHFGNSHIMLVKPIDKLAFSSYEEALKTFQNKVGTEKLDNLRIFIMVDGYPYIQGRSIVHGEQNSCILASMNLVTGKSSISKTVCVIIN